MAQKENKVEFHHNVFKDWIQDDESTLDQIFVNDSRGWKIQRFVKKENELLDLYKVIKENLPMLKQLHTIIMSKSEDYPNIGWFQFVDCCIDCCFLDRNIKMDTLDRTFIASDVEAAKVEGNSKRLMNRYEFFEALVRIADSKYRASGEVETVAAAF